MKLIFILLVFLTMGCQRQMAYHETLRPNGDSTPLEWASTEGTHFGAINQDVGEIGTGYISNIDTTRIAGLNGRIGTTVVGEEDTHLWSDWVGPSDAHIRKLTIRYAGLVVPLPTPSVHTIEVYIDNALVGSIEITIERHYQYPGGPIDFMKIGEEEIALESYITPTQLNTMKTKIIYTSGTSNSFYALECVATTSEKEQDDTLPFECKTIPTDIPLEKQI